MAENAADKRDSWGTRITLLLALLLAFGTTFGTIKAINSSATDRVAPSSTAPVYGSR